MAPAAPVPAVVPAPAAPPVVLGDVPALLDLSRPRPVMRQVGRTVLIIWGVALIGPLLGMNARALESIALLATFGASLFVLAAGASLRRETAALDELEALLALRRPEEAAPQLHGLMARPMHTADNRLRALLLLGGTLSRLGRADDALRVYNELIDKEGLAGPGGAVVKIARATEMLRADHLYDADRAIQDLRRLLDRGGVAAELKRADAEQSRTSESTALAGLRLVELYRDVKTGHLAEALDNFGRQLPALRSGLGHRVAEAHALAALALHRSNRPDEAAAQYAAATALAPLRELVRRYPELWPMTTVYRATEPPR